MVSIAVITYNHENYIEKALESVLNQDYKDIEIIVGDDGSTDKTVEILKLYEKKYPFIHVSSHANWGISRNIYDIFLKCKGEYIAVLEGDDFWIDEQKISKQLSILNDGNYVAVASNCVIVDQNNILIAEKKHEKAKDYIIKKKDVEKYQTTLFLPSGLLFKNIFKVDDEKNIVIRDASKFGGSHSGMINLLGDMGDIYFMSDCMFAWRKVTSGGSNFSSKKDYDVSFLYDQFRKYIVYQRSFDMNYAKYIRKNYYSCVTKINDEMADVIGKRKTINILIYCFIHSFFHILKGRRFRRKTK